MLKTMPRFVGALIGALLLFSDTASAQSGPNWGYGFVPTPGQWQAQWQSKQDYLGAPPCITNGCTMTGPLITAPSIAGAAGFNCAIGVAPTSPNNGDIWCTAAGMFIQIAGATVGPLAQTSGPVTFSGQITTQGLTTTQPGWFAQITGDTFARTRIGPNSVDVPAISFGPGNAARDTHLERAAPATWRFGSADAAAPIAQTLVMQNVVAGTSNTAGANLTIDGSQGTGTGPGGSIVFQVAPAGSTGTAQNALSPAFTLNSAKLATFGGHVLVEGVTSTGATGTGALVFGTSPTLVTPALGTPSSVNLANGTGLPIGTGVSGLGTGVATLLGGASSGTGGPAGTTSPAFVTPALGVASGTSLTLGVSQGSTTSHLSLGSSSANSELSVGQGTNYLSILWTENVTPSLASVGITTASYANPITIDGSNVSIQGLSGGTLSLLGKTFALGGNFAMSGAFGFTGTLTGATNVTFPTSGTLISSASLGTGVQTALGTNVGNAGAIVVNGGALGTPSSGVATNLSGTAPSLTAGTVTTNANLTGPVTSAGNATTIGANQVSRANDAQGIARSVIGVTGNATANVADIQGTANQALVVNSGGTALAFGQVNLASSAAVVGTLPVANGGTGDTGTAWTSYTPTITCGAGSVTTSTSLGRFKTLGKTVFLNLDVTTTAIGTCATSISLSLPSGVTSQSHAILAGRETAVAGVGYQGNILAGATTLGVAVQSGGPTTPVNGSDYIFTGSFESQ